MHVVLYQPQIPQNTGNIVRTCAVTGCRLTLVGPLGFSTSSRQLRRAGLDYWEGVQVDIAESLDTVIEGHEGPVYFLSSKATKHYHDVEYMADVMLVFGSEDTGLPEEIHERYSDQLIRIPMVPGQRCLNLATSAGIAIYEAWRQQDFVGVDCVRL